MMFVYESLLCIASLPLVLGDVDFTQPAAGDIITGTSLQAAWKESHLKPAISTFESFSLFLCAGGNNDTEFIPLFNLQPYATYGEGSTWTGAVSTGWGGNDTNAYFLQMTSTSACGGTIINFSERFTISSMRGTFPQNVVDGIQTIGSSTNGPSTDQSEAGAALSCTASVAAEPSATFITTSTISAFATQPSSTSTASSTSFAFTTSSSSSTLSTGALAGIIATSILLFVTIIGLGLFFLRRRRRRMQPQSPSSSISSFGLWSKRGKALERLDSTDQFAELAETAVCKEMEADKRQPTELATLVRAELPARRSIYEMPAS